MTKRVFLVLATALPVATACVGPGTSTFHYTPPTPVQVKSEIESSEPVEEVWNRLVETVTRSAFSIRNLNEASRVISLSFSLNTPDRYVDCGTTRREFSFRNQQETYEYPLARASNYQTASSWGVRNRLASVRQYRRQTALEGHATLHVASRGAASSVTANAQFQFTSTFTGVASGYNAWGRVVHTEPLSNTTPGTLSFSTTQPGSAGWAGTEVSCQSKGTLEAELLSLAAPRDGLAPSSR